MNARWKLWNIYLIGIENFLEILPRMSRDFLVKFNNKLDALNANKLLDSFYSTKDEVKIFDVDNRGESLFVELVYPNDINENDSIYSKNSKLIVENVKSYFAFVCIKNGEHNGIGYLTSNFDLKVEKRINLSSLKSIIKKAVFS